MPATIASDEYRVVGRAGVGNRLWLRSVGGDRITHIAASGYQGPPLPEMLSHPVLERMAGAGPHSWQLRSDQGQFEFESTAVERIEARPTLYAGLHRPFALNATDRLAVRFLLALLRLPGGAGLLRRWHARRSA